MLYRLSLKISLELSVKVAIKNFLTGVLPVLFLLAAVSPLAAETNKIGSYTIEHNRISTVPANKALSIEAIVEPATTLSYVVVYYHQEGEKSFQPIVMKKTGRTFTGEIPAEKVTPPSLFYYLRLTDKQGNNVYIAGEPNDPIVTTVEVAAESGAALPSMSGFDIGALEGLESEFDMFAAEDVVVSAAKRRQRLSEAPSAVYVLTAEDVKAYGFTTFIDLLRYAPGMDVYRINDGNAIVGVRGFADEGNNLVLVLLDGRQINIELFGSPFLDNLPVTLDEIERIEIVRGPGSTLYGANAFSGIINIITRDPLHDSKRARGMVAAGAIYRTAVGDLYAAGISHGVGYRVSARYRSAGAYSNRFVDAVRQQAIRGVLTSEQFGLMRMDVGLSSQTSEQYTVIGEVPMRMDRTHARGDWNKGDFTLTGSWDFWRGFMYPADGILQQIIPELRMKTHTYDVEARWSHLWEPWDQLTLGANFRYNTFRSDAIADPSTAETRAGVFIQNELYPIDRMTINLGVRSDFSTFYNPQIEENGIFRDATFVERVTLSPRASFVYAPIENHTFRINGGQAFRKPSFWEQNMELVGLRKFASNFANGALKNEKILSVEGGYIFDGIEGLRTQTDFFYYQLRDLIDYDPGSGTYRNNGNANMMGGELAVKYHINQYFTVFGNYSYQQTTILQRNPLAAKNGDACAASTVVAAQVGETDAATCEVRSEASPQHKGNIGGRFTYGDWSGSLNVGYVSDRLWYLLHPTKGNILFPYKQNVELPSYFVASSRVGYRILGGPVTVGVIGEQLQFDDHREFPGLDNIVVPTQPGFPDTTNNYGGEKLGGKILFFVEGAF